MTLSMVEEALTSVRPTALSKYPKYDWAGSRFAPPVDLGWFGECFVKLWAEAQGSTVTRGEVRAFDWRIDGERVEVKAVRVQVAGTPGYYQCGRIRPHEWDKLYFLAVEPEKFSVYLLTSAQAAEAVDATENVTLAAAKRAGAQHIVTFNVPRSTA
jgi:hypothetical protein